MNLSLGLQHKLALKPVILLPPTNWSLVSAFEEEGDQPLRLKKKRLELSGITLEERLRAVDDANEIFRFAYAQAETEDGEKCEHYYKIPLLRDNTITIEDIKIDIGPKEYEQATAILNGAGRFQRIARAVPYYQLHQDVKQFVEEYHCILEDVIVVGIDRGGRLPSFIMREALGKTEGYTIKIDQAGGYDGELDQEKLQELIQKGVFKEKFILFVDSTVDSGRQIEVLRRYFDDNGWEEKIGHRAWGIVGSNENGVDHYHHRNINWGLNPDESFEDNPLLMGVDYDLRDHTRTKVIDRPSETSERIKRALLEVPQGVILDFSNIEDIYKIKWAYPLIERILDSEQWQEVSEENDSAENSVKTVLDTPLIPLRYDNTTERKKLLIVGSGSSPDLNSDELDHVVDNLVGGYDAIAGTPEGNPGSFLALFNQSMPGSAQLYQPCYSRENLVSKEQFGNKIIFHGETKDEFRENMVLSADIVLVLNGKNGTLKETLLSLYAGKPVIVIAGYGAVGNYLANSSELKKANLTLVRSLPEAVQKIQEWYQI